MLGLDGGLLERAPVAVQAFPVPYLQCNAVACRACPGDCSRSFNQSMSAYGPLTVLRPVCLLRCA